MRATVRRGLGGGGLNTVDCREPLPTGLNCKLFFSVEIQIIVLTSFSSPPVGSQSSRLPYLIQT